MGRLENLYTQLMTNRPEATDGWLAEYKDFTGDIETLRGSLKEKGLAIDDPAAFAGTNFEGSAQPFHDFARKLIYERANGISSRGQSILSNDDFQRFISTPDFVAALRELVLDPNTTNFDAFCDAWADLTNKRRPLLLNRVLAACTTDVSTTVDLGKFDSVYWWLIKEKLISAPDWSDGDWQAKNRHLMSELHSKFKLEIKTQETIDKHRLSIFIWELYSNLTSPFSLKKQIVRYGPPGTGKTFTALENAKLLFEMWRAEFDQSKALKLSSDEHIQTVQFHPSYAYEDFMEGLRPILVAGKSELRLQNGVFKELCRSAARWELDVHQSTSLSTTKKNWDELTIADLIPFKAELKDPSWVHILKTDPAKRVADAVPPFFVIIDEMNRAELSRVLGEMMFCLEYRGVSGAVQTQYSQLNDADTRMFEAGGVAKFFVPHNVYVIGTMNTIDRSVESFDFALRRRFRWEYVAPDSGVLRYHLRQKQLHKWLKLADNLDALNQAISDDLLLGPDYQIGHAYLMKLRYPKEFDVAEVRDAVWADSIAPLIEEYLRGTGKTKELMEEFATAFGVR